MRFFIVVRHVNNKPQFILNDDSGFLWPEKTLYQAMHNDPEKFFLADIREASFSWRVEDGKLVRPNISGTPETELRKLLADSIDLLFSIPHGDRREDAAKLKKRAVDFLLKSS